MNSDCTEQRLEKLERSARRRRRFDFVYGFAAALALMLVVGWTSKDQILRIARIETGDLWLRDAKGDYRGRWLADGQNGFSSLMWFGKDSNDVLMTMATSQQTGNSGLLIKNRFGKAQVYLGYEDDSVAKLYFFNRAGDKLTASLIRFGEEATLEMRGAKNPKEETILTSRGIAGAAAVLKSLIVVDSLGKKAVGLGTRGGKDATRFVAVFDEAGVERGALFVKSRSASGFALFDQRGRNRLVSGLQPDGSPYFIAVDSLGSLRWKAPTP